MSKKKAKLIKEMCGLPIGHTISINSDSGEQALIKAGYIAKEEKMKRKTKEEKGATLTKDG